MYLKGTKTEKHLSGQAFCQLILHFQMTTNLVTQAGARSQELSPDLPVGWLGPNYSSPDLLPFGVQ